MSWKRQRRVAVTDQGLALLSHRDRTSLGVAKGRWSVAPLDPDEPLDWRNVSGTGSRQLLRTIEHTDSVHGFLAALATQARERSLEILQLDPPRRASRYFQHDGRLHSVQPDALLLVVFDDELAATHFLRVARENMGGRGSKWPCGSRTGGCWSRRGRWVGVGSAPWGKCRAV